MCKTPHQFHLKFRLICIPKILLQVKRTVCICKGYHLAVPFKMANEKCSPFREGQY